MAIKLKIFRIGDKPKPGEGLRLGVVRYLPRGIHKTDYQKLDYFDLWLPILAPSKQLLKSMKGNMDTKFSVFSSRYQSEILKNSEKRQTLLLLAEISKKTPISIGCYCNEKNCHRTILASLIREAADGNIPA